MLFLHFASNAEVSIQYLAAYYGLVVMPESRERLNQFGLVFNAATYFLIQLAVIQHHPMMARRISELFGKMLFTRRLRRRRTEVSMEVDAGRQNVRDLHGSKLITNQNDQGNLHFRMLRSHWANQQVGRMTNAAK